MKRSESFDYWYLEKYIPENLCDFILDSFTNYEKGTISGNDNAPNRESDICWIGEPFWRNVFLDIIARNNVISGLNFDISQIENLQLTRYIAPHGHYDFHQDGNGYTEVDGLGVMRKLSMSCLLNDPKDFEGGELEFFVSNKPYSVHLKKGDIVIFPSYQLHRVKPVTKGERYSMVAWVSGPQIK